MAYGQRIPNWPIRVSANGHFSFIECKKVDDPNQYTLVISDYIKKPTKPSHLGEYAYEYKSIVPGSPFAQGIRSFTAPGRQRLGINIKTHPQTSFNCDGLQNS